MPPWTLVGIFAKRIEFGDDRFNIDLTCTWRLIECLACCSQHGDIGRIVPLGGDEISDGFSALYDGHGRVCLCILGNSFTKFQNVDLGCVDVVSSIRAISLVNPVA